MRKWELAQGNQISIQRHSHIMSPRRSISHYFVEYVETYVPVPDSFGVEADPETRLRDLRIIAQPYLVCVATLEASKSLF